MSMNEWLAQAYGTNGASSSDLEKTAQAMMLSKLAEQEGIDLSGLDEQQLTLLAQEVSQQIAAQQSGGQPGMGGPGMGMPGAGMGMPMGAPPAGGGMPMAPPSAQSAQQPAPLPGQAAGAGPGPQAPQEGGFSDEQVKVAQAKMAEADFLGRMMAHALHQELNLIKHGSAQPQRSSEEIEAEKTAMAYLAQRGYQVTKQAAAEGPLTRAIRALGGSVR